MHSCYYLFSRPELTSQTINKFLRDYGLIKMFVTSVNCNFPARYSGTSFLATFDTDSVTPGDPIVFNYIVHNTGGYYDPTTGIYTVPLDGTYEIIFRIRAENDANVGAWLVVDGQRVCEIYLIYHCKIIIFYGLDGNTAFHHTIGNKNAFQ